nr:M23 family metallopeptidase [Micromonospora sp. DSM 115978]
MTVNRFNWPREARRAVLGSMACLMVSTLGLLSSTGAAAWPAPVGVVQVGAAPVAVAAGTTRAAIPPVADVAAAGPVERVFRWPVGGVPRPVRRFEPPPRPWLAGHRGVDLLAVPGAQVRSAGAGVVHFAGWVAGRPVISVAHAGGLRTTYEPVRPEVRTGDRVLAGDPIGTLLPGHPGCPGPAAGAGARACLHWGLRSGDQYLDPLALLGIGRVRLLPIAGR